MDTSVTNRSFAAGLENLIFNYRWIVIVIFCGITLTMIGFSTQLRIDASFNKHLPQEHPYMETFVKYQEEFGGANRILIALMTNEGNIFSSDFFEKLKLATDEIFFLPGIDRASVKSLFTPNVRFTEVVAGGVAGGAVIPADFQFSQENFNEVRENILKAGLMGRLVANDFSGAMIYAELLEIDPNTGERLDYVAVASELEEKIRKRFSENTTDGHRVHIIGFVKVMGDIADGVGRVALFFCIAFLVTAILTFFYISSWRITVLVLGCSLLAVIWQLGLLPVLGFGIDPMSILVPFLIFAIAVSHGIQMISAVRAEVFIGCDFYEASRRGFKRMLLPGVVALISDTVGFVAIMLIDINLIKEMAITASLGVAVIILTNLILLPILISYVGDIKDYRQRLRHRAQILSRFWHVISLSATERGSIFILVCALGLLTVGYVQGTRVSIGDLHKGVPELKPDSRYNLDVGAISDRFSIGVDVMTVFVETKSEGCIDYEVMSDIDDFVWYLRNIKGVQSVLSLPQVAKVINRGWNEGSLKWQVLPRNQHALVQATSPITTSSGLLNSDCSVIPVYLFTRDHKAHTIDHIVQRIKEYQAQYGSEIVNFRLAGSIVGVMAATNEVVEAAQFPMLIYVFSAIIALCLISFRSLAATLCIVIPLGLVSLLAYALMNALDIGLKVNTLPVVALGIGIGVDYGIYIYSRFHSLLQQGYSITEAYFLALNIAGFGVMFTGATLALGVATWIFSPLQFQADMGILLTFMFLMNMLGAIVLLPALAAWLLKLPSQAIAERDN